MYSRKIMNTTAMIEKTRFLKSMRNYNTNENTTEDTNEDTTEDTNEDTRKNTKYIDLSHNKNNKTIKIIYYVELLDQ